MLLYLYLAIFKHNPFPIQNFSKEKSLASFLESICRTFALAIRQKPDIFAKKAADFKVMQIIY
jgi:hypothetical protein